LIGKITMSIVTLLREAYPARLAPDPVTGGITCRVDDRGARDVFPGFCEITLDVRPNGAMTLSLRHPPINDQVRKVLAICRGQEQCRPDPVIELELPPTREAAAIVRALADAIKCVTGRGQRYTEPNWKWLAPRTAGSLRALARHLGRCGRRKA
jgi:hypothetical protein